jgi:DNA mismatch repair protein MutL
MTIRVLDKDLVMRIAAGEVVARPASVVKELLENSLDAASSQITVEARGGGVGLIRVTDNGTGIAAGEVELAFERYATSKIGELDDLESITSLGFRGEALPSIAAVAEVDVVTATAGETAGAYISLKEGVIAQRRSQGRSQGTTVTVRNLFRNVPARLKFLKTPSTENSHIANTVSQYALAFPEVKFVLLLEGKVVLRTPGSGQLIDSISEVYGLEVAGNMLEVKGAADSLPGVTGAVTAPALSRSSRNYLSFFVNRRWINSRLLARAAEEAYHGLLMVGKYPIVVINLRLSPQQVDVNVHPTKNEVKFQQENVIFSAVQRAIRQALTEQALVPRIEPKSPVSAAPAQPSLPIRALSGTGHVASPVSPTEAPMESRSLLRILGQLASTYIVAEGSDGLYLIDQHAAHERILFEQIKRQRARQEIEVQGLLEPVPIEVTPNQAAILREHYADLAEFGFTLEPFGDRTCLVRTVPALIHGRDWKSLLTELLDSAERKGDWTENVAISMACHGAIRAGQTLADSELRELVRQLEELPPPRTCPHGRPIVVHLSLGQLSKEFGRS